MKQMKQHLAQANIVVAAERLDHPRLAGFTGQLARLDELARRSPGFVWRPTAEEIGDDLDRLLGDSWREVFTLSVWESPDALWDFTYRREHLAVMREGAGAGWFDHTTSRQVMWWVPPGHHPTVAEALAKLEHLRVHGPTPDAFTFRRSFAPTTGPRVS
jgi:hypothetical protein